MNIAKKFKFDDFTIHSYATFIEKASKSYPFIFFEDAKITDRFILNRHDVDFSLENALQMAEVEAEHGAFSTYFILLHGEYYNPLEAGKTKIIKKIMSLGHRIGLHFDSHFYDIDSEDKLDNHLVSEKTYLESIISSPVTVFSFHNTTPFTMACQNEHYGGLINVYNSFLQENVKYSSDSNGYWRYDILLDLINPEFSHKRLHLLTHPIWWGKEIKAPNPKIVSYLREEAEKKISHYNNHLEAFGMKNIYSDTIK